MSFLQRLSEDLLLFWIIEPSCMRKCRTRIVYKIKNISWQRRLATWFFFLQTLVKWSVIQL